MRGVMMLAVSAGVVATITAAVLLLPDDGAPPSARAELPAAASPAPGDPLTPEEIRRASDIATSAGPRAHFAAGRAELLYVERDDGKGGEGERRADAYVYDYGSDTLTVRTVDLAQGKVVREVSGTGTQPPPSKREETRAAELILAHPRLGEGMRAAYRRAAGKPLRSTADLWLRGLIYTARRGDCAEHRCVRLFVRLPDGTFLDTSRVVADLSAKKVHILEW
ncbi:hypothetical protein [Nonomuraea rhodomycinica]|uniref:Tat pathway signal sequence domain protein n=1 Tax=Nonomuraea rhodomycinica TaxID=1712872 RepID=A0A7Y6IY54_9ACTN|nr:hypothetical protein [Nonomuraea rhodomycinica]NUW45219.1 hypothetical protein [Nonomuraea rhodomycinica]